MGRNIALLVAIILIGLLLVAAFSRREVQQIFIPSPTPTPSSIITPTTVPTQTVLSPAPTTTPAATSPAPSPTLTPQQSNNIRVTSPQRNQIITTPLRITGQARGSWFFEATAPVKLIDANGRTLADGFITAQGDWMTTNFVPFSGELSFAAPATNTGQLILEKSNPSGLPENDEQFIIPIRFR